MPNALHTSLIEVRRVSGTVALRARDSVAIEDPLEIQIGQERNGIRTIRSVSVTMRTPGHDDELAIGFLFGVGILNQRTDVAQIEFPATEGEKSNNRVRIHSWKSFAEPTGSKSKNPADCPVSKSGKLPTLRCNVIASFSRVIPGFENFNERVREGYFHLPHPTRDGREFSNKERKAKFTVHRIEIQPLESGHYWMMTIRSHDQFNTTIYGLDDRYRGVYNGRRVIFMNPDDMREAGLQQGEFVDLTSHFQGEKRTAAHFQVAPYEIPRRCTARITRKPILWSMSGASGKLATRLLRNRWLSA